MEWSVDLLGTHSYVQDRHHEGSGSEKLRLLSFY